MTVVHDADLRRKLADELHACGDLRSPVWRAAVEAVPRHLFVSGFFEWRDNLEGRPGWDPVRPDRMDDRAWLEQIYRNETLVTQIEGRILPSDVDDPIQGEPTSSSSLPGLVVLMLEDLEIEDGHAVLEIGTGTGYSTALLCHRLGEDNVTSVEIDPHAAAEAAAAIRHAGYAPTLVVGDGLAGHPAGAPYDRVIATCSVRRLPAAWLEQTRPGGLILATISGWLHGSGLALLTVADDGTAEGRFLPGTISFMIARPQAPPPLGPTWLQITERPASDRAAVVGPDILDDWDGNFVAQLAAPGAQNIGVRGHSGPRTNHLIDVDQQAFASLMPRLDGTYLVRQGGPVAMWDAVEEAVTAWRDAGSPGVDQFRIRVTPDSQTIWFDGEDRLSFSQP